MRSELEEAGEELPVDSILVVESVTRLEASYSVKIPADQQTAKATRSVCAFAGVVWDAIVERQQS